MHANGVCRSLSFKPYLENPMYKCCFASKCDILVPDTFGREPSRSRPPRTPLAVSRVARACADVPVVGQVDGAVQRRRGREHHIARRGVEVARDVGRGDRRADGCADALHHLFAVRRGGGHRIRHQQDVEAVPVDGVEGGGGDAIVRPRPEQHDRVDAPRLEHRVENLAAAAVQVCKLGEVVALDHARALRVVDRRERRQRDVAAVAPDVDRVGLVGDAARAVVPVDCGVEVGLRENARPVGPDHRLSALPKGCEDCIRTADGVLQVRLVLVLKVQDQAHEATRRLGA
mmetsp:Transcript_9330/g.30029  ORF Transcript_9330/g.30029 Transcript_9330/m.30029 type:complete len:288 (+) Transcript_9330:74-937(+)